MSENTTYIFKEIQFFFETKFLACDACCEKAWGINNRPRDEDENLLLDSALGQAPADPGVYEGGDAKPLCPKERLNKWCARECERSIMADHQSAIPSELKRRDLELKGA